ncbi:hypothetical protein DL93DRAFT_2163206 [Clavulina sp. PMI_390]|nr:hypothetical protein DL93DRAFT_2163206 [Clavulina sp. PMI_390]
MSQASFAKQLLPNFDGIPTLKGSSSSCSISPQQSFHFTLSCNYSSAQPTQSHRHAYALLTLPPSLFIDPYELAQRAADGDGPPAQDILGETNLELALTSPSLDMRGSAILFKLEGAFAPGPDGPGKWSAPLHARYLHPASERGADEELVTTVAVPAPVMFVAKEPIVPLETLLQPKPLLAIQRIQYSSHKPESLRVTVPIGHTKHLEFVEPLTIIAVLACFLHLAFTLVKWRLYPKPVAPPKPVFVTVHNEDGTYEEHAVKGPNWRTAR